MGSATNAGQKQVAMTVETRAALMDLAAKVSAMREIKIPAIIQSDVDEGQLIAFNLVLETIFAELDRK
jgi:hypothetical protein